MSINLEKLYENAYKNLHVFCRGYAKENDLGNGEVFFDAVKKNPSQYTRMFPAITPAVEIWMDSREALMKSKGGTVYSAVKRIVKRVGEQRASFNGFWIDSEGRQCFCDGYMAVRLKNHVDGFETVPGTNLASVMTMDSEGEPLALPTPGELKAHVAEQPGGKYVVKRYDFGSWLPWVDAKLLKDILDIFPNATAKTYGINKPILFEDDTGDAILLPIRKDEDAA